MLLKDRILGFNSVAFRLGMMYALIHMVSFLAVFAISYLALQSTLQMRLDEGLASEIGEYKSLLDVQDIEVLRDVLDREANSEGTDQIFFRVLDISGIEVLATNMVAWEDVGVSRPCLLAATEGSIVFETHRHHNRIHAVRIVYGYIGSGLVMQLGESTIANIETLKHFRYIFEIGILASVFFSLFVGIMMARRALSGVRRVTQAAKDISAGEWERRVSVSHRFDEIDELAMAFNEMVDRIQILILKLREVTDNIAHDLRTPITRMRMAAESILSYAQEPAKQEYVAGHVLEECDQLLELIKTMLEISQTEAGARPLLCERLDIAVLTEDVYELFRPAAEDKNIDFMFTGQEDVFVDGEAKRLKHAVANIFDNAIKYTEAGGAITIECSKKGNIASISVCDTGMGIPSEDLEEIFTRFYRVDKSRTENGNGLGLSLSIAILKAHGGDITVRSVLGEGSTFTMILPVN